MIPWMLDEILPPDEAADAKPKVGFNLNWTYTQNCGPDPTPEPGVCTFMGMPSSELSGFLTDWDDTEIKKAALGIMKKHGYRCETPPTGWQPVEVMGKTTDTVEIQLALHHGWFYIRCNSHEAKDFVEKYLRDTPHYELGLVHHEEERFELDASPGFKLVRRTGGDGCLTVGTMFELQKGSKTIAKALCSYRNRAMENSGPSIELFEVAGELRRKGYGKLLFQQMTNYFEEVFIEKCDFDDPIKYNVCYCTSRQAFEFFTSQGFRDWDGMGEELGKFLGD